MHKTFESPGTIRTLDNTAPVSDLEQVYAVVRGIDIFYPGFHSWFFQKVAPGLSIGERAIFVAQGDLGIRGVAIAKRCSDERKLSTIWVADNSRCYGIASALAAAALEWLETNSPLFSIPEERMCDFQGLLNRWNCSVTERQVGYYRPGKTEFVFNGRLKPMLHA